MGFPWRISKHMREDVPPILDGYKNIAQIKISKLHFDLDGQCMLDSKAEVDTVRKLLRELKLDKRYKTIPPLSIDQNMLHVQNN